VFGLKYSALVITRLYQFSAYLELTRLFF